jgi:hypothetical protein
MSVLHRLGAFESISLAQTNELAGLMRRVDTKYVIRPDQLEHILQEWVLTHRVLEIENKRIFHYHSIYYDTPALDLYHAHHAGAGSRVKFRVREYTDTQLSFYEVKQRSNKGITDKQRLRLRESVQLSGLITHAQQQYARNLRQDNMQEALQVDYDRITLVAKDREERITIDLNLVYRAEGREISFPDRVIIEVKHGRGKQSPERDRFRRFGVRAGSISKYCLGILSLYPHVKQNRFKPSLRILAKQLKVYGTAAGDGGARIGAV